MSPALQQRALASFVGAFDSTPTTLVQAPGRVNLIGEHTDYNQGFVLPCAIDFHTVVAARARSDQRVRVVASDFGHATDEFRLDQPIEHKLRPEWANYVRGVFAELVARGLPLQGMNLAIAGDVPRGAGLSSSASLEVALARTAQALMGWTALTPTDLALIAQRAENDFVGCQCGIMDQLISARGQAGHALLIDCRDLSLRAVPLPADAAVLIVHSHVQRGLVDSHYNLRREQCQAAATALGLPSLRDLSAAHLAAEAGRLDDTVRRRAQHVVSENARTLQAAEAFEHGDLPALGRLMAESHRSMRDDFEITVPAIDRLVEILQSAIGDAGGARMTGGGFGGCAVAVLPAQRVPEVVEAVERHYRSPEGRAGTVHVTSAVDGAQVMSP
jgi:galactokinase